MRKKKYKVIGLMSGTSLDGLDIACCIFRKPKNKWRYEIEKAVTIKYNKALYNKLDKAFTGTAEEIAELHSMYGHFCGNETAKFIKKYNLKNIDFISSHGHTIFHQPKKNYTLQIGNGAAIAAETGLPVVCDFRTKDMALGGQGAPLVPIGDYFLFTDFDLCLNIGGFANISARQSGKAFDICPANIVLNELSLLLKKPFDKDGAIARSGEINILLLNELNKLSFYKGTSAKSLGKEWVESQIKPVLHKYNKISIIDLIATYTEHVAIQIANSISQINPSAKVIVTGGGAFNGFLIERIKSHTKAKIELPSKEIISFKEALIFAFLGVLRWEHQVNSLKKVTGAKEDNIGGAIYL